MKNTKYLGIGLLEAHLQRPKLIHNGSEDLKSDKWRGFVRSVHSRLESDFSAPGTRAMPHFFSPLERRLLVSGRGKCCQPTFLHP